MRACGRNSSLSPDPHAIPMAPPTGSSLASVASRRRLNLTPILIPNPIRVPFPNPILNPIISHIPNLIRIYNSKSQPNSARHCSPGPICFNNLDPNPTWNRALIVNQIKPSHLCSNCFSNRIETLSRNPKA